MEHEGAKKMGQIIERDGRSVVLPPGPKCRRCDHEPCPFCNYTWCDQCVGEPDEHAQYEHTVNAICADTWACDFDDAELAAWKADCEPLIASLDAEDQPS